MKLKDFIQIIIVFICFIQLSQTQDGESSQVIINPQILQYNYMKNGEDWTQGECFSGIQQSPVNIQYEGSVCKKFLRARFFFRNIEQTFTTTYPQPDNDLFSITANVNVGDFMATSIWQKLWSYTSQRMEIKSPSEHTVNGQHFSAELQIHFSIKSTIFEQAQYMMGDSFRQYGAISLFLEVDNTVSPDNTILGSKAWDILNIDKQQTINPYNTFDSIFPHTGEFYTYEGSSSNPPCEEEVSWFVYRDPLPITSSQLNKVQSILQNEQLLDVMLDGEGNQIGQPSNIRTPQGNNRKTKVLFGRKIFRGGPLMECVYKNPGFIKREKEVIYETNQNQIQLFNYFLLIIIVLLSFQ